MFKIAKKEELKEKVEVNVINCSINAKDVKRLRFIISDIEFGYALKNIEK